MKTDGHGHGLQAVRIHDPVVEDAADYALKTIQQRSDSLVPYELKETLHANAEVWCVILFNKIMEVSWF